MKTIILASLLSLSCLAAADDKAPRPPTPPGPPTGAPAVMRCDKGTVVFAEQVLPEGTNGGDLDHTTITLYAGGKWERVDHKRGKDAASTGCMDHPQLAKLTAELAKATWKVDHQAVHCLALGATFTRFTANGKAVYDAHVCGDPLDEASAKILLDVRTVVEQVSGPHTPPCCKN